jgi:hypothetical protein
LIATAGRRFGESLFKSSGLMDYRHHRASREVQVIIVPVPCGGSPEPLRRQPPPAYPVNRRQPWRPADKPPRLSKAEALKRLLDEFKRQDEIVREMMTPSPAGLKAWLRQAA